MLLITLEDAVNVTMNLLKDYTDCYYGWTDADIEYVKTELEQKCYIAENDDAFNRLSDLIMDITPAEIASQIESDNLKNWCRIIQIEMNMALINIKR